ncbi:MAG TPA: hypothetical protein VIG44_13890 [Thermomicrobiales bacterium]|jgi:hypothetical protein
MRCRFALLAVFMLCLMPLTTPARAASSFAAPAFDTQWHQGEALATNFWGPLANATPGLTEQYLYSGTNKTRLVQYFDKGRMERYDGVTNTPGVQVTSGLLAKEMVTGQIQIADDQFMPQSPPDIAIAGDAGGSAATYADLGTKAARLLAPAASKIGQLSNDTIQPSGDLGSTTLPPIPQTTMTVFDDATKHNVPGAFAQYRERAGLTNIGYAISEPFHATVKVAGAPSFVMVQVFERRVLTYTDTNPDPYKVEMGNIGQHYYKWRYPNGAPTAAPAAAPANTPPSSVALTQTWTDPVGFVAFQYPASWKIDPNFNKDFFLIGLTGPGGLQLTLRVDSQAPSLDAENDAYKANWQLANPPGVFSAETAHDGTIGGEPAKLYAANINVGAATISSLNVVTFHGGEAYNFTVLAAVSPMPHMDDINAILGSVTFLK